MRVLVADDDALSRQFLGKILNRWGFDVLEACDGFQAWQALRGAEPPQLAILDWQMPGLDGLELCRRARTKTVVDSLYIVLVSGHGGSGNLIAGLRAGANDYLTKPFDFDELRARLNVGSRIVERHQQLTERIAELEQSLDRLKQSPELVPMCAWCKKVRTEGNDWQRPEEHSDEHGSVRFSHGICPECFGRASELLDTVTSA